MDLSDDSSRGSSKSNRSRSRNGSEKSSTSKSSNNKVQFHVSDEQIEQFIAVTGSTVEVARTYIEACRGNLERAVDMHMEGLAAENARTPNDDEDFVRAPIPQKQEVLVQPGYEGYGFNFKGKRRIVKSVFDSFRNFEVEAKLQESRLQETNGLSALAGTSSAGKRSLEELFRPPIDIIFNGNLQTARDAGKSQRKWLMVNIQNVSEFCCQVLNRDVWSRKSIKELVKENFIFLQLYMDSEEGQRYMTFYKVTEWPYVAILDPRTGELMAQWNYSDAGTYEQLIAEFVATASWGDEERADNDSQPPDTKKRRVETILDASEDDQIQAAIRASLAESCKPAASNNLADSEDDNDDDEEEDEETADWFDSESDSRTGDSSAFQKARPKVVDVPEDPQESAEPLPPQPSPLPPPPPPPPANDVDNDWERHLGPDTDPSSSIIFRFPDGSKEQKTLPSTSTLTALIKYAGSKGFPRDKYELVANFPKRQLLDMDADMTLKDAGLFPQDTIFVHAR